jgi:hypothetical protein
MVEPRITWRFVVDALGGLVGGGVSLQGCGSLFGATAA